MSALFCGRDILVTPPPREPRARDCQTVVETNRGSEMRIVEIENFRCDECRIEAVTECIQAYRGNDEP